MNKISIFLILLFPVKTLTAQYSISPSKDNEYCPKVNLTFSVTIPGYDPFISSGVNSPTVVSSSYPSVSPSASTTFTFVANFRDINTEQTFRVSYKRQALSDTIVEITFNKIKSFFYSSDKCSQVIQPNQSIILSPSCQINTHTISFNKIEWFTLSSSSSYCFGNVTDYEYLLPSGWKLGSTTSDGNAWLLGGNIATITSDLNTGDNSYIQIRPANTSCVTGLTHGQSVYIQIKRNPTFTISPASFQIPCGTSSTKTVSVNMSFPTGCSVSYNWSLSNPYTYTYPSGGFVPQTFTTTSPSFTFSIPAYSGVLPTISVTPVVNGVSQPTLICTASRTPIDASQYPDFAIVGQNSICSSENYSAVNIPAGFTVHWYASTYPYGASVAQINSPTSVQTSITAIGSGVISLIATITNQCGQQISITKSNISVGGGLSTINGYFTNYLGQYENLKTNYDGVNYVKAGYLTNVVVSNPELASATWSYVTGGYNFWTQYQNSGTGTVLKINLPITNDIVLFRLTNSSSCGTQTFDFLFWAKDAPYKPYYSLSPNPASEVINVQTSPTLNNSSSTNKISQGIKAMSTQTEANKSIISDNLTIKLIEIIDMTGKIRYHKDCTKLENNTLIIPVSNLSNGVYLMKIFNGQQWNVEKIIVQH